ncbi:MAG: outer membrane beta-barrel protein [Bacteroidia bacterium]
MRKLTILFSILVTFQSFSQQTDSIVSKKITEAPKIKISGYVDAYYAYYTDSVGTNNYQKFPDISPKSNQFGLNIVQITAQYSSEKVRAVGTLHYGDIASSAWSPVFNMIQEANAGVRLTKKIWLDAGFFKTHIGTEVLLPKDNITSSLSIITLYEPWWQAGFKLSYTPNDKLLICLHVLNGYNTYIDNNKLKSFGLTLSYALGEKGSIGYYNLIGDESPDNRTSKHVRFLNNLVLNYQLTPKLKTIIGVDYITQQNSRITDTTKTASIYSGILILKYQLKPAFGIYARGETFSDRQGFLTGTIVDNAAKITGYVANGATLGIEYKPTESSFIRLEGRELVMDKDQQIFHWNKKNVNNRLEMMVNVGVAF